MTTIYPTKEIAINAGVYFATGQANSLKSDIRKIEGAMHISQFGQWGEVEIYELTNSIGRRVRFGISACCSGYDLWLITEDGTAVRT